LFAEIERVWEWLFGQEPFASMGVLDWVFCFAPLVLFLEVPRYFLPGFLLLLSKRRRDKKNRHSRRKLPFVSVIVAGRNEEACIQSSILSLLRQDYPRMEILVVDDSSDDATAAIAKRFSRYGSVRVIRNTGSRGRCGKPGAMNLGLSLARGEVIVGLDADTVFDSDLIRNLVERFEDPNVGVVAGNVIAANWNRNLLTRLQALEYLLGIELNKSWKDRSCSVLQASGAVGAFRAEPLREIGGWDPELAEDTDVSLRMVRAGWKLVFARDAVARTSVPSEVGVLGRQRARWDRGGLRSYFRDHVCLMNPARAGWSFATEMWLMFLFSVVGTLCYPVYLAILLVMDPLLLVLVGAVSLGFYGLLSLLSLIPVSKLCRSAPPARDLIGAAVMMPAYKEWLRWVRLRAFVQEALALGSDDPFLPSTAWAHAGCTPKGPSAKQPGHGQAMSVIPKST